MPKVGLNPVAIHNSKLKRSNPIEKMWSKIKQILMSLQARTREELFDAIAKALNIVTAVDAQGWFASCGYVKYQS